MNIEDLPDDSDTSDDDYIPNTKEDIPSEVDSDGEPEELLSDSENSEKRGQKRKKKSSKIKKKPKNSSQQAGNSRYYYLIFIYFIPDKLSLELCYFSQNNCFSFTQQIVTFVKYIQSSRRQKYIHLLVCYK